MQFTDLAQQLSTQQGGDCPISNGPNPELSTVADIEDATPGSLSFIDDNSTFGAWLEKTAASALILPKKALELQERATARNLPWIGVPQPRLAFAQAIALFYTPYRPPSQIHPTAVIDPSATLGNNLSIGAHVVISANVTLGNNVCIHPNVVIYPGVSLGDRTLLHANCTIHERTQIGADCVIHSGAVIGAEGFGFVPTAQDWVKMEQAGYVILEDQVEVGCNSTVDRPAVGTTRIGRDTKLDNMVHIGHGCKIGQGCAMAGQVGLAGGVELGNGVILAGQVGVANRVKIGDRSTVSSKGGVQSNVPANQIVSGHPAIPHRVFLKASAIFSRLPEMYKVYRQIQREAEGEKKSES